MGEGGNMGSAVKNRDELNIISKILLHAVPGHAAFEPEALERALGSIVTVMRSERCVFWLLSLRWKCVCTDETVYFSLLMFVWLVVGIRDQCLPAKLWRTVMHLSRPCMLKFLTPFSNSATES